MKRLSASFLFVAIISAFFAPPLTCVSIRAITTIDPIYQVGLFRPRLDGFLEHGPLGSISEWDDDSALEQIKLIDEAVQRAGGIGLMPFRKSWRER